DAAGTLVASGDENGGVRLWSAADLTRRGELPGSSGGTVLVLIFSPDGKVLAVSRLGRGRIELWNVADGAPRLAATLTDAPFSDFAQTPPQPRRTIAAAPNVFRTSPSLAVSADGALLAVSGENYPDHVRVWDLRGEEPVERTSFPDRCKQIALSADGRLIATA